MRNGGELEEGTVPSSTILSTRTGVKERKLLFMIPK